MDAAFYNLPYTIRARARFGAPNFSNESFENIKAGLLNNGWVYEFKFEQEVTLFTATFHSLEIYHQVIRPVSEENRRAQAQFEADFRRCFDIISTEIPPPPLARQRERQYFNQILGRPWTDSDTRETTPRSRPFRLGLEEQEGSTIRAVERLNHSLDATSMSAALFTNAIQTFSNFEDAAAFTAAHITPNTLAPPPSWNELAAQYLAPVAAPPQPPAKPLPIHVRCGVRKIHRATP